MKKSLLALLGAGLLGLPGLFSAAAADPTALMHYDFGAKPKNGIIPDLAGRGAPALQAGADTGFKNEAAVFRASEESELKADPAAFKKWLKGKDLNELSASFWIRFDKVPRSDKPTLGVVDCRITADGFLEAAFIARPTDLISDRIAMKSKIKAETGKWYHVEMTYSFNSRRCTLYVDGKFQFENDALLLPLPTLGEPRIGQDFRGAVRDLRIYDAALPSEELAVSNAKPEDWTALAKKAAEIQKTTKVRALGNWAAELKAKAEKFRSAGGDITIAQYKRLKRDIENAAKLNEGLQDTRTTIGNQDFTVYSVPATTQALYLPYELPKVGSLANKLELFLAQDEYESASIIVVPFRDLKNFHFTLTDLKCGNDVLPASDIETWLVKRWFRTGGAWLAYHVDLRMRTLTPDLLIHDDKLVRVDEFRRTNELLMHYPSGDQYSDVSRFDYDRQWMKDDMRQFFYDAPTLQPMDFPEAGRNQQFLIHFHAPKTAKPGLYTGKLNFTVGGRPSGSMDVELRVLPFVLSQPKVYDTPQKNYMSHVNSHEGGRAGLINGMKHNLMHLSEIDSPLTLKLVRELGYPTNEIFAYPEKREPWKLIAGFDGPDSARTPEIEAQIDRIIARPILKLQKRIEKYTGVKDYEIWYVHTSEASHYTAVSLNPDRISNVLHKYTKAHPFSHGMSNAIVTFSPGIYDMDSNVKPNREWSEVWHSTDGRMITYAAPFPGPENPGLMRRALGMDLYKKRMDGHMMHGYTSTQFNEFTKYPGGDGDYRTFALAYLQKDGIINRLAIVGCREGYDDVRYASTMKLQALKYLHSENVLLAREAKRQLAWLERWNGEFGDLDSFRSGCAYRILTLQDLAAKLEGKK